MYKTNRQLKQEAKQALSGKWMVAVLMTMAIGVITYSLNRPVTENASIMVSITSLISSILNIILNVGFLSFFLKICCGLKEQASFKDLFYGFQCHPGKAILLNLLTILYMLPGTLIYMVLVFVFMFVTFASTGASMDALLYDTVYLDPSMFAIFWLVFIALTLLYLFYAIYIAVTYGLVYYLLLDYPDLTTTQIWKRSAQLMKGHRWRKVKLELSFIPWLLLSVFTLFIGAFWVVVYMNASFTEFYLDLVKQPTSAMPNQSVSYGTTNVPNDMNLTHDCAQAHPETQNPASKDYSGIDANTFK